jgi:tetrapyrrole methylase family protein / MazG family protein
LRTKRHPAVADLPPAVAVTSFDAMYETAVNFEEVYSHIISELLRLAQGGPSSMLCPAIPMWVKPR